MVNYACWSLRVAMLLAPPLAMQIASSLLQGHIHQPDLHGLGILSKLEVFSEPDNSGSTIVNICGHIGGMLTSSFGKMKSSNITYAMPFWWLLKCIRTNGFPNVHLNIIT
jgi:hypothetical protein